MTVIATNAIASESAALIGNAALAYNIYRVEKCISANETTEGARRDVYF
jgi:hypothetical protein